MGKYDSLLPPDDGSKRKPSGPKGSGGKSQKPKKPTSVVPKITRMSDVEPEPVNWLWPGRIALGKLTMIAGDPGLGKSFLTIDLAARVSSGRNWPDGSEGKSGSVIFISGEDDPADTIRPRMDAADADVSKCEILEAVTVTWDEAEAGRERSLSLKYDVSVLESILNDRPDCRLLVIDPLSAYLGEIDSHKNADVRSVLRPLADLASRFGVAIVCVEHLNKRAGGSAIHRTQGSIGIIGAARAAWLVAKHPQEPEGRLFLPIKNNLGNDRSGLSFTLVEQPGAMTACLSWSPDAVTISADELLNQSPGKRKSGAVDAAEAWLLDLLAERSLPAKEVWEAAKSEGLSRDSVKKAKGRLGIKSKKNGIDGGWEWHLDEGDGSRPEMDDHTNGTAPSTPSDETREKRDILKLRFPPESEGVVLPDSTPSEQNGHSPALGEPF